MVQETTDAKNDIDFPAECTFKAVFRKDEETENSISRILDEKNLSGNISARASKNGTFISFTVTAWYENDEELQDTCRRVSALQSFMTLF